MQANSSALQLLLEALADRTADQISTKVDRIVEGRSTSSELDYIGFRHFAGRQIAETLLEFWGELSREKRPERLPEMQLLTDGRKSNSIVLGDPELVKGLLASLRTSPAKP